MMETPAPLTVPSTKRARATMSTAATAPFDDASTPPKAIKCEYLCRDKEEEEEEEGPPAKRTRLVSGPTEAPPESANTDQCVIEYGNGTRVTYNESANPIPLVPDDTDKDGNGSRDKERILLSAVAITPTGPWTVYTGSWLHAGEGYAHGHGRLVMSHGGVTFDGIFECGVPCGFGVLHRPLVGVYYIGWWCMLGDREACARWVVTVDSKGDVYEHRTESDDQVHVVVFSQRERGLEDSPAADSVGILLATPAASGPTAKVGSMSLSSTRAYSTVGPTIAQHVPSAQIAQAASLSATAHCASRPPRSTDHVVPWRAVRTGAHDLNDTNRRWCAASASCPSYIPSSTFAAPVGSVTLMRPLGAGKADCSTAYVGGIQVCACTGYESAHYFVPDLVHRVSTLVRLDHEACVEAGLGVPTGPLLCVRSMPTPSAMAQSIAKATRLAAMGVIPFQTARATVSTTTSMMATTPITATPFASDASEMAVPPGSHRFVLYWKLAMSADMHPWVREQIDATALYAPLVPGALEVSDSEARQRGPLLHMAIARTRRALDEQRRMSVAQDVENAARALAGLAARPQHL